jgi:hypothetical protein
VGARGGRLRGEKPKTDLRAAFNLGLDGSGFSVLPLGIHEGTKCPFPAFGQNAESVAVREEANLGRGILLWLLGVPIPVIILVLLFWHH